MYIVSNILVIQGVSQGGTASSRNAFLNCTNDDDVCSFKRRCRAHSTTYNRQKKELT